MSILQCYRLWLEHGERRAKREADQERRTAPEAHAIDTDLRRALWETREMVVRMADALQRVETTGDMTCDRMATLEGTLQRYSADAARELEELRRVLDRIDGRLRR